MFRTVLSTLTALVVAYLASLAGPVQQPDNVIHAFDFSDALGAHLYSGDWDDDFESEEPLWCDGSGDPRCAPAAPPAPLLTWAPLPTVSATFEGERTVRIVGEVQKHSPTEGLSPCAGTHTRVERPPQA